MCARDGHKEGYIFWWDCQLVCGGLFATPQASHN